MVKRRVSAGAKYPDLLGDMSSPSVAKQKPSRSHTGRDINDCDAVQGSLFDIHELVARQLAPHIQRALGKEMSAVRRAIEVAVAQTARQTTMGTIFAPIHDDKIVVLVPKTLQKLMERDFGDLCRTDERLLDIADALRNRGFRYLGQIVMRTPAELGLTKKDAIAVESWLSAQEMRLQFGMDARWWKPPAASAFVKRLVF